MTRLLYLSAHSVLEFDEVSLFRELGHYVFSPGAYVNPQNRGEADLRPDIPGLAYDPEDLDLYHRCGIAGSDNKVHLSRELVSRFDAVVIMHTPDWITLNWPVFRETKVRVIWRTIGQSIGKQEAALQHARSEGLQIVRYSPAEERIPGCIGQDAMIRFYKDPEEWGGWTGNTAAVLNVGQDVINRGTACNYEFMEKVTRPFARKLIGRGSEAVSWGAGKLSFAEVKAAMQAHRVFFFTGTLPASYTLGFVEALMTGAPVVSIGKNHGNDLKNFPGHDLFEVPDLLKDVGFSSDDPFELMDVIAALIQSKPFAQSLGEAGRRRAIELFGKSKILGEWKEFLG